MKMSNCKTVQVLMAKEQAGDLSAQEQAYLQNHFKSCASCRERSKELTSFFESLSSLGRVKTAPSAAARSRFITQTKDLKPVSRRISVRRRTSSRTWISSRAYLPSAGRNYLRAFAAAAAIVLVAGAVWMTRGRWQRADGAREGKPSVALHQGAIETPARNTAPVLISFRGTVTVQRAGQLLHVGARQQLLSGDRLETSEKGQAQLRYADGTVVEVNINTLLAVGGEPSGKRLTLERGDIFADVAKQPRAAPMILNPGRADQVRVVGTVFELSCRNECTRLRMAAGLTSFGPSDRAVVVKEGLSSQVEHDSPPSEPTPCEPGSIADWRNPVSEATGQLDEGATQPSATAEAGTPGAEGDAPPAGAGPAVRPPIGPVPGPTPIGGIPVPKPAPPIVTPTVVEPEPGDTAGENDPPGVSHRKDKDKEKDDKDKPDKPKDESKAETKPTPAPPATGSKPVPPGKGGPPKGNPKPPKSK
jgi:hypothetical protein